MLSDSIPPASWGHFVFDTKNSILCVIWGKSIFGCNFSFNLWNFKLSIKYHI